MTVTSRHTKFLLKMQKWLPKSGNLRDGVLALLYFEDATECEYGVKIQGEVINLGCTCG